MDAYKINGGKKAFGEVTISGNKNSALPLIAATLLTDESVILKNIPNIKDVNTMLDLVKELGSKVELLSSNTIKITSGKRLNTLIDEKVELVRGSILFMGPLLGFFNEVVIAPPGGDVIGFRRIDTHFMGFTTLGASCSLTEEGNLKVSRDKLKSNEVFLEEASVTATENVIMVAALIEGCTTIINAACEPHVQDLCNMLNLMGCHIEGIGSNLLKINGVKSLRGCEFTISSDYMEAGSFIGLAAATKGEILIHNVDYKKIKMIESTFEKIGIKIIPQGNNSILVPEKQNRIIQKSFNQMTNKIDDSPWPGFPADLLSILTVTATQMNGTILMHEKMFESRMYFVDWLIRMGADIILCDPHRAVVNGPSILNGARVSSPDLRAGMALVIAAACCKGECIIENIYQIERGYENLEGKLKGLNIDITKVENL
jgi:UDP-N-acetylglucosamine 1-carboxyvinyltransferase